MKRLLIACALLVLGTAQAASAAPMDSIKAVEQAERDFADYTKVHGYAKGFLEWSTADAITFQPEAVRIHDKLAKALADDPTLDGKATPLRWGPFYVGAASSGDVAFDLGPWTMEGSDRAGWFFTIWNRQGDGTWRWSIDGGAGVDTPGDLPAADQDFQLPNHLPVLAPDGLREGLAQDDAFNAVLARTPAKEAFAGLRGGLTTIASDGVPPFIPGHSAYSEYGDGPPPPPGAMTQVAARKMNALAARPGPGLTWQRDGQGVSKSGDFVYTYGHAYAADLSYVGHYVRVWEKLSPDAGNWVLTVDVFQK